MSSDFLQKFKEFQNKKISDSKVSHKFASYSSSGILACTLCSNQITTGSWQQHLLSRGHMDNLKAQKKQSLHKEKVSDKSEQIDKLHTHHTKRPFSESYDESSLNDSWHDSKKMAKETAKSSLPEGFFDDPRKDAAARNTPFKDPNEQEWEKFQMEISKDIKDLDQIETEEFENALLERDERELAQLTESFNRVKTLRNNLENFKNNFYQDMEEFPETNDSNMNEILTNHHSSNHQDEDTNDDEDDSSGFNWKSQKLF